MTPPLRPDDAPADAGTRTFRAFYAEHVHRVTALAVAMTADRAAAEDVAQETFARALRDWDRVREYDDPGAWARTVAANLARSRWRRLRREADVLRRLRPQRDHVELPERSAEVWRAVRQLPRRQAVAIALRYVEDMSVDDIAATLDVPAGTVKSDLHRGRRRLADLLTRSRTDDR